MNRIPHKLLGFILWVMLGALIIGGAFQIIGCVEMNRDLTGGVKVPKSEQACNSFFVENTGRLLFSDDYEQHGQVTGQRVFVLDGFWSLQGRKYVYYDSPFTLDERLWGKVTVKRRC